MARFKVDIDNKNLKYWSLIRTNPRTNKKFVSWYIKIEKLPFDMGYDVTYGGKNKKRVKRKFKTKMKAMKYINDFKRKKSR